MVSIILKGPFSHPHWRPGREEQRLKGRGSLEMLSWTQLCLGSVTHLGNCRIRLFRLREGPRSESELVTLRKTWSQPHSTLNKGPGSCPLQPSYPLLTPNHP